MECGVGAAERFMEKGNNCFGLHHGRSPDQYFVPNYKNLRTERQRLASALYPEEWPEFSNNTYSMKNFQQAWGLPIFADNWAIMGENH
jgi:hypothetical protein